MNKDILILGKGFIGLRLQQELGFSLTAKEIKTFADVYSLVKKYKPKVLINCIGNTGTGNVDGCEKAKDFTLLANTYVPILLADVALRERIKLVHISSGCIFHYKLGQANPINESAEPDYHDLFYSRSKIICRERFSQAGKNA